MAIADIAENTSNLKTKVPSSAKINQSPPVFSSPFLKNENEERQASDFLRQSRPKDNLEKISPTKPAPSINPVTEELGIPKRGEWLEKHKALNTMYPIEANTLGSLRHPIESGGAYAKMAGGEGAASSALREAKLGALTKQSTGLEAAGKSATKDSGKGASLAQMGDLWRQAKGAKSGVSDLGGQAAKAAVDTAAMAVSAVTSEALKQSWLNLIDSWGATILYINFHVFARFVFGEKFFCKLGQEWLGGKGGLGKTGGSLAGAAGKAEGQAAGSAAASMFGMPMAFIGLLEAIVLGILDILLAVLVLISLTPFILILLFISDPIGSLDTTLSFIYAIAKSAFGL